MADKADVAKFWDRASCGEEMFLHGDGANAYAKQAEERYGIEPHILRFGDFTNATGKKVLEIGVGLGADHELFARAGAVLTGLDITSRAIEHTKKRFEKIGLVSNIQVGDAENLPFPDAMFDIVYSYGVIHHSPDTAKCAAEIWRVLKPGGIAKVMIYHTYSMVGYMLWLRYAAMRGKPFTSLREIYAAYLESPGTKAYSIREARRLLSAFSAIEIEIVQTHGDLLSSGAGQRHKGAILKIARILWPRWFIRAFMPKHGLHMLITALK
jgi:ubiquinone/menaquinone biosynthesis C-methylase UbiE